MRKIFCLMAVACLLFSVTSILAQEQSMVTPTKDAKQAAVQGKSASLFSFDWSGSAIAAWPAFTVFASVAAPTKHKSKKGNLLVDHTLQIFCGGGEAVSTLATVDGWAMEPDPFANFYFDCINNNGYETFARNWFSLSEKLGGPPLPKGATVNVVAASFAANAFAGVIAVHVTTEK